MSESDEDLMPNSVNNYQHETVGWNNTNITSFSFRNNVMASTYNMSHMNRQRYDRGGFDQRSIYYRRGASPMSLRSFPDAGNYRGMSSQRSVFNGRSGSPMSMRSIGSNASVVSAADIASALTYMKFNHNDLRLIKDAYNKLMKNSVRKRIEKRRNRKLLLKGNRKRWGEDSGEQGSDSSISSDDCRSSRTIIHKENIPKTTNRTLTTYDLTQIRSSMKESNMYKDCTENLRQNSLRNMFTVNSQKNTTNNKPPQEKDENNSVVTLKERFAKGASFQLPSQRFNKSKVISNETSARNVVTENPRNKNNHCPQMETAKALDTDSDKEEIFSQSTVKANSTHQTSTVQRKRVLDDEETNLVNRKRSKTAISPIKENDTLSNNVNMQKNDFNFKKPKMPIRKISNVRKDTVPEILIAKSRQPLAGNLELNLLNNNKSHHNSNLNEENPIVQNKEPVHKTTEVTEHENSNQAEVTQNTTDVSMRPSFLKRKLFTQKLDIADSKNISSDNVATNSPQTKMYNTCREKNKVRKIVSSQSCLSRDVLEDDNVLDLIHKIVPPDQINMTNAMNKKDLSKNNQVNNDKWDVASVISMCKSDEGSDTYTDEEIFKVSQISNKTNTKEVAKEIAKEVTKEVNKPAPVKNKVTEIVKPQPKVDNTKKLNTECKVVVKKLETKACNWKNDVAETQCQNKRTVISNCVKSFWDTDFESDIEERTITPWTSKYPVRQDNVPPKDDPKSSSSMSLKRNVIKGTILTVRSFQNRGLNSSARSDISRVSKKTDYDKRQQENNKIQNNNNKTQENNNKNQENNNKTQENNNKTQENNSKALENDNKTQKSDNKTRRNDNKTKKNIKKTPKKNTKSSQNHEEKAKEQDVQSTKPQNNSKSKNNLSNVTNEKPKSKPAPIKQTKSKKQKSKENNECNTSRESQRLKQKKEQNKLNSSTKINDNSKTLKKGRTTKGSEEKNNDSNSKTSQIVNKKSKESSNKDVKSVKNTSKKAANLNRTRQTPRKCNEKRQLSSSVDRSSLNLSNVLSRSLRLRQKCTK